MTYPALLTLVIFLAAAALLSLYRMRADLIALLVLAVLGVSGLVPPEALFTGFSSPAVLTIVAVSIISEGLRQAGVTRGVMLQMRRLGGRREWSLAMVTMLTAAGFSLFMNNIAVVAVLLPAVTSLARHNRLLPSRLLMPLAFGTILGGMATLLTTSNIIVSSALQEAGSQPFRLLDFLPIGIPIILLGIGYMILIGSRLLPNRYPAGEAARSFRLQAELSSLYGVDKHLNSIKVLPDSSMAGHSLQEGGWMQKLGLWIVGLQRGDNIQIAPRRTVLVQAGDVILAQGNPDPEKLKQQGLDLLHNSRQPIALTDETVILTEAVLAPHSSMIGKSLKEIQFREKYGFNVLSIWREGKPVSEGLAETPLQFGDALLIQGPASRLGLLSQERAFLVLEENAEKIFHPVKGILAILITFLSLGLAATGYVPVAEASLAGAVLLLVAGILKIDEAYRAVEWRVVFLVAGMWPLGTAIFSSGLAGLLMNGLLRVLGPVYPEVVAAVLILLALVITQLMSGQVASLAMAPLALTGAAILKIDPRTMGMAVALGCSLAFITPYGHLVNRMVMNTGGYTARDYLRVGAPLTVLILVVILIGLHFVWGL